MVKTTIMKQKVILLGIDGDTMAKGAVVLELTPTTHNKLERPNPLATYVATTGLQRVHFPPSPVGNFCGCHLEFRGREGL